jgi:hypothetical protein
MHCGVILIHQNELFNILEYSSQKLNIHGQRILQFILFLFMNLQLLCVFTLLKIWMILFLNNFSLSTSNIKYDEDIMFLCLFLILQLFPHKLWLFQL